MYGDHQKVVAYDSGGVQPDIKECSHTLIAWDGVEQSSMQPYSW